MPRRLFLGLAAGLVAGPIIGLVEAVGILTAQPHNEYVALFYAVLLYAAVGVPTGAAAAASLMLLAPLNRRLSEPLLYSVVFMCVMMLMGLVNSGMVPGTLFLREQSGPANDGFSAPVFWAALFLAGIWLGPIILTRTPFKILLKPRGTLALYGTFVLLSAVFGLSPSGMDSTTGELAPSHSQSEAINKGPNILFIVPDSLRIDHMAAYGASTPPTPGMDELARDAIRFQQAISQSSSTKNSVASMFSSLLPSTVYSADGKLDDDFVTLAEVLQAHGVVTGAVVTHSEISRNSGLGQGFDYYEYLLPEYPWGATQSASQLPLYQVLLRLRWTGLSKNDSRTQHFYQPADVAFRYARNFISANEGRTWFLFLQLMDTHEPYFRQDSSGGLSLKDKHTRKQEPGAAARRYAEGVSYLDSELAEFVNWLKNENLYEDLVLVLVAAHGEQLTEHRDAEQSIWLYDEFIHVPLLVKLPRHKRAGESIPFQVRLLDLPATVLGLLDMPAGTSWMGRNLLQISTIMETGQAESPFDLISDKSGAGPEPQFPDAIMSVSQQPTPEATDSGNKGMPSDKTTLWSAHPASMAAVSQHYIGGRLVSSIRDKGWKLIQSVPLNNQIPDMFELFNLHEDPHEELNLLGTAPEWQGYLSRQLSDVLSDSRRISNECRAGTMDNSTESRLRTLGYNP